MRILPYCWCVLGCVPKVNAIWNEKSRSFLQFLWFYVFTNTFRKLVLLNFVKELRMYWIKNRVGYGLGCCHKNTT